MRYLAVDIDESRDEATEARTWGVGVSRASEAIDAAVERKDAAKRVQADRTLDRHARQMQDAFIGAGSNGLTKTSARDRVGLNGRDADTAIGKLLRDDVLEECKVKNGGGTYDGFRLHPEYRKEPEADEVGLVGQRDAVRPVRCSSEDNRNA